MNQNLEVLRNQNELLKKGWAQSREDAVDISRQLEELKCAVTKMIQAYLNRSEVGMASAVADLEYNFLDDEEEE